MSDEIRKIGSVQDYLDALDIFSRKLNYLGKYPLYRGMANVKHDLLPKLFREVNNQSYLKENERDIIQYFLKKAYTLMKDSPNEDDYPKIMSMAQHYNVPSRMLDWSENCLVALYFAVEDTDNEEDGVVWVINSSRYRDWLISNDPVCKQEMQKDEEGQEFVNYSTIRNINSVFTEETSYYFPFIYYPWYLDERMNNQKSVFMVWGSNEESLNIIDDLNIKEYKELDYSENNNNSKRIYKDYDQNSFLLKLVVSGCNKSYIKNQLAQCGVNELAIYPTLDRLGKDIDSQYKYQSRRIFKLRINSDDWNK